MKTLRATAAGWGLLAWAVALAGCHGGARPGAPAPAFSVRTRSGKAETLADYRGRVLVLNFWATWCPPCIAEVPSLNALQAKIAGERISILGIAVDQDGPAYRRFLAADHVAFPTARDATAEIPKRYGTVKYPETYIIDPEGRVARKIVGPANWTDPVMLAYLHDLATQE